MIRALLVALCFVSLASAGCGRYGPPRRAQPVRGEQGIEIEKKGGRPAPETPAPRAEPEEEEEEPQSR